MDASDGTGKSTRDRRIALFHEAVAIVEAEYARALTVDGVAARVASSARQLRRAFAEAGGTSFRDFLSNVRMTRAAELLASTELPVAEVGRRVGCREPSQFSKAFKRAHHVTPSAFRRERRTP